MASSSAKEDFVDKNKFKELFNLLKDRRNSETYNRWLNKSFPQIQTAGKDGKLFTFFKKKFGLDYGDNDKFKEIDEAYKKLIEQGEFLKGEPGNIPELDLSKIKKKDKKNNQPKPELIYNIHDDSIFEKNEKGDYKNAKLIKLLVKKYKNNNDQLSKETIEFIDNHKKDFAEALYEIHNKKYIHEPTEQAEIYDKKLKELEYIIEFPKNELEKKKALQMKKNIEKKIKDIYVKDIYKNKITNGEKLPDINQAQLNSYIPTKQIPLFVKNSDGPGFHRITPEEIQALKNDPSGDYYEGNGLIKKGCGLDYKKLMFERNLSGSGYCGSGGYFINTNYKPMFPTIPFEPGW